MSIYDVYSLKDADLYDAIQADEEFLHRGLNYAFPLFQRKEEILWMLHNLMDIHGKFQHVVEIGSLYGANLIFLSKLCMENGYIVGIEPSYCGHFNTKHITDLLPKHEVIRIPVPSHDKFCLNFIRTMIGDPMLNTLLFIDGFHSYEEVKRDWDIMMPLVGQASVVVFHDLIKEGPLAVWTEVKMLGTGKYIEYISPASIHSYGIYGDRAWGGIGIYFPGCNDE